MNKVLRIIEDKLGLNENEYTMESSFTYDLGCDSLDFTDIIMECEREFNIVITDEELVHIVTIQDLVNCIAEHTK